MVLILHKPSGHAYQPLFVLKPLPRDFRVLLLTDFGGCILMFYPHAYTFGVMLSKASSRLRNCEFTVTRETTLACSRVAASSREGAPERRARGCSGKWLRSKVDLLGSSPKRTNASRGHADRPALEPKLRNVLSSGDPVEIQLVANNQLQDKINAQASHQLSS